MNRVPYIALLVVLGCGGGSDGGDDSDVEWSYSGDRGPSHWAELSPDYAACGQGVEQSPVDFAGAIPSLHPALEVDYLGTPLVLTNNGHTIEVEYREGSSLTVAGETWEVMQFHFHISSEHTIQGNAAPMELHIAHRDPTGARAVLGTFIEIGEDNDILAPIFDHLPSAGVTNEVEGVEINIGAALPPDLSAWRYDGSLTTPPCDEGVRWFVLGTPIRASASQIGAFTDFFHDNARPTQPLNDRFLG